MLVECVHGNSYNVNYLFIFKSSHQALKKIDNNKKMPSWLGISIKDEWMIAKNDDHNSAYIDDGFTYWGSRV